MSPGDTGAPQIDASLSVTSLGSMEASVVVVQHGEKVREPGDPGLTARGLRQAAAVARVLAPMAPVAVVSSPLRRARETAAPLATALDLPVREDHRLRERLNLEAGDQLDTFVKAWERSTRDRSWTPPGGRSSETAADEALAALSEHAVAGGVVAVVSHGGVTTDLLRTLLGDAALERRAPGLPTHGVPGCGLTRLTLSDHRWHVAAVATLDHLAPSDRSDHER